MSWGWLIGAAVAVIAAIVLVRLTWRVISNWFSHNIDQSSAYGTLIKEKLSNGNCKVIGGVFDSQGTCTAAQAWETDELDDELEAVFSESDQVLVEF